MSCRSLCWHLLLFFLEMQSVVKQNLHSETEEDLNKLVKIKLTASYTYLALVRLLNAVIGYMD